MPAHAPRLDDESRDRTHTRHVIHDDVVEIAVRVARECPLRTRSRAMDTSPFDVDDTRFGVRHLIVGNGVEIKVVRGPPARFRYVAISDSNRDGSSPRVAKYLLVIPRLVDASKLEALSAWCTRETAGASCQAVTPTRIWHCSMVDVVGDTQREPACARRANRIVVSGATVPPILIANTGRDEAASVPIDVRLGDVDGHCLGIAEVTRNRSGEEERIAE